MSKSRNDRNHQRYDDEWDNKRKGHKPKKDNKHEARRLERAMRTRNIDELLGED